LDCRTFAISGTFKLVIRYNLTSFRNRVGVQSFLGRPITFRRLSPGFVSCASRPCLRLKVVQDGVDAGLAERIESAELKTEDFEVEGLVLNSLLGDGMAREKIVVDGPGVEEFIVVVGRARVAA